MAILRGNNALVLTVESSGGASHGFCDPHREHVWLSRLLVCFQLSEGGAFIC